MCILCAVYDCLSFSMNVLQSSLQESQEASSGKDTTESGRWAEYVCWSVSIFFNSAIPFSF